MSNYAPADLPASPSAKRRVQYTIDTYGVDALNPSQKRWAEYWGMLAEVEPEERTECPFCINGYIAHFKHIDGGVCYRCDGKG